MSDFSKYKKWLKEVSFLTESDCAMFEKNLRIKKIAKKDHFLRMDEVCKEMGFINYGAFRVYYLKEDKEVNTHFSFENQFVVNYDSFIQNTQSKYYIQALEDSEIVTFNLETLESAYKMSKNWERFGRMMAEYSYKLTTRRVESFLFLDAESRYLQMIEDSPQLINQVPLYHLASYLGIERESLSRLRKKISEKERL